MFACCVGDINQEPGEIVETKTLPVLQEKGTQSTEKEDASGSFTVLVPAKRHATLGLEPCLGGWLLWDPQRSSPSPYRSPPKNGFRLRDQYRCMMDALLIWSRYDVPMRSNCETDRPRPFAVEARNLTPPVPMDQPLRKWRRVPWMISTSSTRFAPSCHTTWWCKWAMPREPRPSLQRWPHLYMTLDFRDLRYWATTSPGKESAVLWFRHETVGIHFLPWAGNRPGHQQKGLYAFFCWNNNSWKHSWTFHIPFACDSTLQSRNAHHAHQTQLSPTFDHFIGLFQLLSTVQPYVWKWYL